MRCANANQQGPGICLLLSEIKPVYKAIQDSMKLLTFWVKGSDPLNGNKLNIYFFTYLRGFRL